jgi:hypothetical protein
MNWQPIETAPTDGTKILVWDGIAVEILWVRGDKKAWKHIITSEIKGKLYKPTHWMPIPEAPKKGKIRRAAETKKVMHDHLVEHYIQEIKQEAKDKGIDFMEYVDYLWKKEMGEDWDK